MTTKFPSQIPSQPNYPVPLNDKLEALVRYANRLFSAVAGRSITELDLAGSLAVQQYGTLVIAGGVIDLTVTHPAQGGQNTASVGNVIVDTEGAAAADDLDTIDGVRDGALLLLRCADNARVVTLKDGTGNLCLGADVVLDDDCKLVMLVYDELLAMWLMAAGGGTTAPAGALLFFADAPVVFAGDGVMFP